AAGTASNRAASCDNATPATVVGRVGAAIVITSVPLSALPLYPGVGHRRRDGAGDVLQDLFYKTCSVNGGPGSGDSGAFSRCSSQAAMLWNSGAPEVPGDPSAAWCGLSIISPMT